MATFVAIQLSVRAEIHTSVVRSLWESQGVLEQVYATGHQRDSQALAAISANSAFVRAVLRAERPHIGRTSQRRARKTLQELTRAATEITGAQVAVVTGTGGRLVVAWRTGPGAGNLQGFRYGTSMSPVFWHRHQIGTLSAGTPLDTAGLNAMAGVFGPVALLHGGGLVRSTLSPAIASRLQALGPDCAYAGCEFTADAGNFLVIPIRPAAIGANLGAADHLVVVRSIDSAVDRLTGNSRPRVSVIAAGITFLALLLAAYLLHVLLRPLRRLIARLEMSQAEGRWDADFPEDSPSREVNLLAAAINRAAIAVTTSNQRIDQVSLEFVETMAQALDARDPCTAGHSQRVSDYATAIATTMGLPTDEIENIRLGARLHDIGKIGISDTLLQKTGRLTPDEYETVKRHPQIGRKILERVAAFERYLPFVELHHEDFDGHGYPHGLKGDEIPLGVRIVRVADVFDALTTDRAYRDAMPLEHAYEIISSRTGAKFDPDVVRALRATLGNLLPDDLRPGVSTAQLSLL